MYHLFVWLSSLGERNHDLKHAVVAQFECFPIFTIGIVNANLGQFFLKLFVASAASVHGFLSWLSVPGWIRTNDLPLRRRLLYPAGLREHSEGYSKHQRFTFLIGCLEEGHLVSSASGSRTHTLLILSQLSLPLDYRAVIPILEQIGGAVKSEF